MSTGPRSLRPRVLLEVVGREFESPQIESGAPHRGRVDRGISWRRLVLGPLILTLSGLAHAYVFDPAELAHAQGTYRFEDGTCVTGGRMDEGGVRLLYMDVWHNRMGLLLESRDGTLMSLVPPGREVRLEASGDRLALVGPQGDTRIATRQHRPNARAIHFSHRDLRLAGTLYTPHDAAGRLPAVILAHGSGAVDRFGGPWVTFFTDLGFAVLAYDKRGVGESAGDWRTATYVELAEDLEAAVDWLAKQPEVDPGRLGIHATSQSGWYAPLAAAHDPRVRFLIQRAGPALWIGPVTRHERERLARRRRASRRHRPGRGPMVPAKHPGPSGRQPRAGAAPDRCRRGQSLVRPDVR